MVLAFQIQMYQSESEFSCLAASNKLHGEYSGLTEQTFGQNLSTSGGELYILKTTLDNLVYTFVARQHHNI